MNEQRAFMKSTAHYFTEGGLESLQYLVVTAADKYIFNNFDIYSTNKSTQADLKELWAAELKECGVDLSDEQLVQLFDYRRLDATTYCFLLRHFLAFGAGLEKLLRLSAADTNKEIATGTAASSSEKSDTKS